MVLATLGSDAHNLRYYYSQTKPPLDIPNQLMLTLTKLRTHPPNTELAFRFTITVKQVSNIFITWINFMYRQWKQIKWWPSQELTRFYAPASFKETFPDTRAILDGTECPIKQPKQPMLQQSTVYCKSMHDQKNQISRPKNSTKCIDNINQVIFMIDS